jgi:hypothetical protein
VIVVAYEVAGVLPSDRGRFITRSAVVGRRPA